jgi:hypothetical protein
LVKKPVPPDDAFADIAGNGEKFWFGDHGGEAAQSLAREGRAILGGEIYRRHDVAWATYTGAWRTDPPRRAGESWSVWVERGLQQAVSQIEAALSMPGNEQDVRIFLAWASEPDGKA